MTRHAKGLVARLATGKQIAGHWRTLQNPRFKRQLPASDGTGRRLATAQAIGEHGAGALFLNLGLARHIIAAAGQYGDE
jgi:hypothetical protein